MTKFARQTVRMSPTAFNYGAGIALAMDELQRLMDVLICVQQVRAGFGLGTVCRALGTTFDYYDRSGDKKYGVVKSVSGNTFMVDGARLQFRPESSRKA